jgi:hypothetical protein
MSDSDDPAEVVAKDAEEDAKRVAPEFQPTNVSHIDRIGFRGRSDLLAGDL